MMKCRLKKMGRRDGGGLGWEEEQFTTRHALLGGIFT